MNRNFNSLNQAFSALNTVLDVVSNSDNWCTSETYTITDKPYWATDYTVTYPTYLTTYLENKELSDDIWKNLRKDINSFDFISSSNGSFPHTNFKISKETKDMEIEMALAGYKKEDIDIIFDDDLLIVKTKEEYKKDKKEEDKFFVIKNDIKQSSFEIKFNVPFDKYNVDKSKAVFENGVLRIDVPVKEEAKPKRLKLDIK